MRHPLLSLRIFAFVAGATAFAISGLALGDPPSRVARLGYITGTVSFSPGGESDWIHATMNRPLTTGDRLWADAGARSEIQLGGAMVRMSAGTGVSILNLDDRVTQLQLTQGTLNVRVRRLATNEVFEVDTPNLAFTLRGPGEFRIEVDPEEVATTIFVRRGQGEVYGEGAAYVVDSRQSYRFTGTGLREYEYVSARRLDEFDRWSTERDRRYESSISARYVSQDVVGYHDLDANGTWRVDATYGNVWIPTRVAADWAPYRDGHWAWVDPWGWTWVDDAPWGFAVSHYGRWANLGGTWGWVPGPASSRAYYAPALVAFVGGDNFQLAISSGNIGGIAWFALGPREVYRPSYTVSRGYFENVNRTNTVINTTVINNYYNNTNVTNIVYANREVPGAIVAVPTTVFVQSQPVSRAAVRVSRETIASAPIAAAAPVAPTERSVRGAAAQGGKPPAQAFARPVVARTAPAAPPVGFAAQQQQLTATQGKPLDADARRQLKPTTAAPAPVVNVVAPPQALKPSGPPPAAQVAAPSKGKPGAPATQAVSPAPATQPLEAGGKPDPRGSREARGQPVATPPAPQQRAAESKAPPAPTAAPAPAAAPAQATAPAPVAQPPEQRGKPEQRGSRETREQPVAAPPAPQQRAAESKAPPAQAAAPAPLAQPPEQRGKPEQRGSRDTREQPVAAPPAPQQRAAEARPPAAALTPPPPPAQPRSEEGKSATAKGKDKKKDGEEPREEEGRQKR